MGAEIAPTLHREGGVARGRQIPHYHNSLELTIEFYTTTLCRNSNKRKHHVRVGVPTHATFSLVISPSISRKQFQNFFKFVGVPTVGLFCV